MSVLIDTLKEKGSQVMLTPTYHPKIVQMKISLLGIEPLIWRCIQVPDDMSLGRLHDIFQVVMGWQDGHLHAFHIGDRQYTIPPQDLTCPRECYAALQG